MACLYVCKADCPMIIMIMIDDCYLQWMRMILFKIHCFCRLLWYWSRLCTWFLFRLWDGAKFPKENQYVYRLFTMLCCMRTYIRPVQLSFFCPRKYSITVICNTSGSWCVTILILWGISLSLLANSVTARDKGVALQYTFCLYMLNASL